MSTEHIDLNDSEFVQITDGTNCACIEVISAPGFSNACWCDSATVPTLSAAVHERHIDMVFRPPLCVYVRSKNGRARITVTRWHE